MGTFWTFCTPPDGADCFRGAFGGTGTVFCGGVDGVCEAMIRGVVCGVLYVFVLNVGWYKFDLIQIKFDCNQIFEYFFARFVFFR